MAVASLESRRFSRAVERFEFAALDDAALDELHSSEADMLVVRLDARSIDQAHRLLALDGDVFVADTLVVYSAPLVEARPLARAGVNHTIRRGGHADTAALDVLVRETFTGYKNHYASNPTLPPDEILDGFVEWARSFVDPRHGDLWLVDGGGAPIGFAGCRESNGTYDILLNGVHPAASGRGVYGDIVNHAIDCAAAAGCSHISVSTQVGNLRVQRAWVARNLRLTAAYNTFHVNRPGEYRQAAR